MQMKKIEALQVIVGPHPGKPIDEIVMELCQAGVPWIQLRCKDASYPELKVTALAVKNITDKFGVTLIINDHPQLVVEIDADGVHLGKEDMDPSIARTLLGSGKIIGGTANNHEDILRLNGKPVNYIGVGPLRFTTTKKKLSPVLGVEGIRQLIADSKHPAIAIGGVNIEDLSDLFDAGASGVAVSGSIVNEKHIKEVAAKFVAALNELSIHEN